MRVRSSDAGVTVAPRSLQIPGTGIGLLTVQVRAASGTPSGTTLRVEQYSGGVTDDTSGPSVVTMADGWHFARP